MIIKVREFFLILLNTLLIYAILYRNSHLVDRCTFSFLYQDKRFDEKHTRQGAINVPARSGEKRSFMYFRIGVVESDPICLEQLSLFLDRWAAEAHHTLYSEYFNSSASYDSASLEKFDIVFINTDLKALSLAGPLRKARSHGEVVFLADLGDSIPVDSSMKPLCYLLKPLSYSQVAACLTQLVKQMDINNYIYQYRNQFINIPYSDILYFSTRNHQTEIITVSRILKQADSLKNIALRLPPQFQQCHRTAIINLEHVQELSSREVILKNQIAIPISATYKDHLKEAFMSFHNRQR